MVQAQFLLLFSHSVTSDSATPWTVARQASFLEAWLSFTISWSLLKLMSIESMMLFFLCHPLLLLQYLRIWTLFGDNDFKGGNSVKIRSLGTSLVVQWLRLLTPNAGSLSSIPGQGTRSHTPQLRSNTSMPQLRPSQVRLFRTQWTVARQAPLSMEFSRQEYWSG